MKFASFSARLVNAALLGALTILLAGSLSASARPTDGGDGGGGDGDDGGGGGDCLSDTTASLWVSPAEIALGGSVTVNWSVHPAARCRGMTQTINGFGEVASSGSKLEQPTANRSWIINGHRSGASRELASASVKVHLPQVNGRPTVTITSDDQVGLFLQAIGEYNAVIRVQNHVNLDLSYRDELHVAAGVHIIGGRSSTQAGPRLFTTTFPRHLFMIGRYEPADGARVTGVRLQGAEMGSADADSETSVGIAVYSSRNVEIDNNEISGWRGAGVEVRDTWNRIALANYDTVRVHDNTIHHNQQYGGEGYGVSMHEGAYALIERNYFDYNRHAIASAGTPGTGYYAHRNLVGEHGGFHSGFPLYINTHQFDVHGSYSCGGAELSCGDAGEKFDMRYNTILYTKGTSIKVRGKPSIDAVVDGNVFSHSQVWSGAVSDGALKQNEPGDNLYATNNTFGAGDLRDMISPSRCDFDGDGVQDFFYATSASWWYIGNNGYGNWAYLNTSTKRLTQLVLGDVNGDGFCDVTDNEGGVFLTPPPQIVQVRPPEPPPVPYPSGIVPNLRGKSLPEADAALRAVGLAIGLVSGVVDQACNDLGTVASHHPMHGTRLPLGATVDIKVRERPQPPQVCK
jgi:Right handed beta helix region/PASTA domain